MSWPVSQRLSLQTDVNLVLTWQELQAGKSPIGFRLQSKSDMFKYLDFNTLGERVNYKQVLIVVTNNKKGINKSKIKT